MLLWNWEKREDLTGGHKALAVLEKGFQVKRSLLESHRSAEEGSRMFPSAVKYFKGPL